MVTFLPLLYLLESNGSHSFVLVFELLYVFFGFHSVLIKGMELLVIVSFASRFSQ